MSRSPGINAETESMLHLGNGKPTNFKLGTWCTKSRITISFFQPVSTYSVLDFLYFTALYKLIVDLLTLV